MNAHIDHMTTDLGPGITAGFTTSYVRENQPFYAMQKSGSYAVGLCGGSQTLTIAKILHRDFAVKCWVPRLHRKNPTKRQAHTLAALPGFVFIKSQHWDRALEAQANKSIPGFSALLMNGKHAIVTTEELLELNDCVTRINIDADELGSMRVGDDVHVVKGPMKGMMATLDEIYIDMIPMAKLYIRMSVTPNICLPLSLIRAK